MAANNYFSYGGTQYAAANAAYQQTQQAYGVPAATGATTPASYSNQRTAYDAAYQTSATPVTYAAASATTAATYDYGYTARAAPAAVGVTYDSAKTYYQQAAPTAAAVAGTPGQVAVTVASTPDFQNWQQASYSARQTNAAAAVAAAAVANKAAYNATYSAVPTTRQLTVPPITPKVQTTTNSSPYVTQYTNQQPASVAPNYYNTVAPAQNAAKAAAVGTIGQPPKKQPNSYQQKPVQQTPNLNSGASNVIPQANPTVTAPYNPGNPAVNVHPQNNAVGASVYNSVPATAYSNPTVGNTMYNSTAAVRPKTNPANAASNPAPAYSNPYDAALFNAAATMYMNQNPRAAAKTGNNYKPRPGLGSNPKFRNYRPPKPQQLHYCDACKISCAGPSAYHDHLQGQKHKKKVAKAKPEQTKSKGPTGGTLPVFVCELCDIECTAADAYAAHLRGAKHTKVVKLHTRLGKPIPPPDPKAAAAIAALNAQEEAKVKTTSGASTSTTTPTTSTISVRSAATPRITFVAAGTNVSAAGTAAPIVEEKQDDNSADEDKKENDVSLIDDRPAVGSEYIEEEKDASGKLISFNCKLCECKFSDPNAKEMHMKGRKHRLQFKKKVDPKLKVEMKPNNFKHKRNEKWKKQTEKQKDGKRKDFRYEDELKDYLDWCRKSGVSGPSSVGVPGLLPRDIRHPLMRNPPRPLLLGPGVARLPAPTQSPQPMFLLGAPPLSSLSRKLETFEDRHVMARHRAIYPSEMELKNIQKVVGHVERALKLVSDHMLVEAESKIKKEDGKDLSDDKNNTDAVEGDQCEGSQDETEIGHEDSQGALRELTGVLRIGIIAKGLILTGDDVIDLVMLCSGKPTMSLLTKVVSLLPEQLKEVCKDSDYAVASKPADAAIVVSTCPKDETEKKIMVQVTLTSTVIREEMMAINDTKTLKEESIDENGADTEASETAAAPTTAAVAPGDGSKVSKEISPDPPDVLSKTKCLEALAALRHAKWFQARAAAVQSCLIVIRILRDLCRRVPTWAPFNSWAMELLCEKILNSSNAVLSPGDGLRRVFEGISSGLLLPDGPGLLDPCEKDPVDAAGYLTAQQREDITASAQHALRLIAFRQIHKVLGMEQLPPMPKFRNKQTNRKRRRENSAGGRNEGVEGKKDKKDAEEETSAAEEEKMDTDKPITK